MRFVTLRALRAQAKEDSRNASEWTEERAKEYFKSRYGDRGLILIISDYQYAVLPRGLDKWVYVDVEHQRVVVHDTLTDTLREYYGDEYPQIRILRCGPETSCARVWREEGCEVELVSPTGEREVREVCTVY